jgi:hypothetical protein
VANDANSCVYYNNDHIEIIIRIFVDGCSHNPMSQKGHWITKKNIQNIINIYVLPFKATWQSWLLFFHPCQGI